MTLPQTRVGSGTTSAVRDPGPLDTVTPALPTEQPPRVWDRRGVVAVIRLLLATASGLSMWVAFPPYDLWWAALFGATVLTVLVRGQSGKAAFGYGALAGLALFAPLLTWTSNVGPDAWLALSGLQALFLGGLGVVLARVGSWRWWPMWTAAAWVAQEALRGRFPFGGFTWGRLAFAQTDGPLLDYATLGGAPLVTFLTVLLGGVVVEIARRIWHQPRQVGIVVALGGGVVALSTGTLPALSTVPAARESATVAAVQGNVPRLGLDAFTQQRAVLDNHARATRRLAADVAAGTEPAPDLVLWPENSSDLDPYTSPQAYRIIDNAVQAVGVPTLVGAVVGAGPGKVRNSGIVWDPQSGPGETYVKQHPVPFAEYVPYRSLLTKVFERFAMVPRDFVKGEKTGVLRVGPARLGDVICFEVAYDPLVRETVAAGAQFLVVQTNNATFGYSDETEQQLAMSRLRAVEHGRDVLVVATSGVSAVIGPDGEVRDRAEVFTAKTLVTEVGLRDNTTPATRYGGIVEAGLAAVLLIPIGGRLAHRSQRGRLGSARNGSTAAEVGREGSRW